MSFIVDPVGSMLRLLDLHRPRALPWTSTARSSRPPPTPSSVVSMDEEASHSHEESSAGEAAGGVGEHSETGLRAERSKIITPTTLMPPPAPRLLLGRASWPQNFELHVRVPPRLTAELGEDGCHRYAAAFIKLKGRGINDLTALEKADLCASLSFSLSFSSSSLFPFLSLSRFISFLCFEG